MQGKEICRQSYSEKRSSLNRIVDIKMIKRHILIVFACMGISITHAMYDVLEKKIMTTKVPLPEKIAFKESLHELKLGVFADKKDIYKYVSFFSNQSPKNIIALVDNYIKNYNHSVEDEYYWVLESDKRKILYLLFCKAPQVQNLLDFKQVMFTYINLYKIEYLEGFLRDAGFGSFALITKIHEYLGSHGPLYPMEIVTIVDNCIDYYNDFKHNNCSNSEWILLEEKDRQKILRIVFANSPGVYQRVITCDKWKRDMQAKL